MIENSPYTGMYDRSGMVALGQVVAVDSQSRRVQVKTIGGQGTDTLDLHNVRVMHGMWHSQGDDQVSLPRVKTYGIILFVSSEAFWLGACPLDMSSGELQRNNQDKIDSGDWLVKTIANNKIIVRSGGTIEIQSTDACRTFWIPSQDLINTVCHNFELETSGGHMKWKLDEDALSTNLQFKVWNSVTSPDNGVTIDIGTIPETAAEESSENIKPYAPADLIFDFKQGTLDETLSFAPRSLRMSINKDGSLFFDIGPGKFTLTVDSATGDVNFETKGNVTGLVKKDVNLTVEGAVTAKVTKDITVNAEASVIANVKKDLTASVDGKASISAKGGASIQTDGDAEINAKGKVTVSSGGDASITAKGKATVSGTAGTDVGSGSSPTNVNGQAVNLAGGGAPVARLGDQAMGIGNRGAPVISQIIAGSPKVTSG